MKLLRDSQLTLLWTARIDYSKGSQVEPHTHSDYDQLLVVLSGHGKVTFGQQECDMQEGHAYLFMKGISHSFRFTGQSVTLDFKFRLADPEMADYFSSIQPFSLCESIHLAELKQWYKMSLLQARKPGRFHPMSIEAGFKGTLVSLLASNGSIQSGPYTELGFKESNDPIVHYMKMHFAEKITLGMLSKHFGFNPNYLIKRFFDKTGMTPIQYLQEIRLEKAKEYLEFTDLPISEVAEMVGWTQAYFSKILKKRTGLPPSQYRDSLLNAIGQDIILEENFSNVWRIVP
ncbi:AraC family transcriptional regulator [Paenibacillus sp. RC67]|uniref:AraC family transcriptional regulator n=1 Tax=Paenibacillus sp. RC67 TaxID=3039392 RepID=UPI0024AD2E57|nr:AraC family transcriptional regulator [Paenibacillus sp. RC67]